LKVSVGASPILKNESHLNNSTTFAGLIISRFGIFKFIVYLPCFCDLLVAQILSVVICYYPA